MTHMTAQSALIVDEGEGDDVFVCAHGAGGNKNDRATAALAKALAARGLTTVRFDFDYAAAKSKRPDPMPKCMARYAAVVDEVRTTRKVRRLFLGGRSMGGRAATMMAADGFACDALLLYAYPLHPAGRPEKLRDAHLPNIAVPVLCFNGTRDDLCTPELMRRAIAPCVTRGTWEQVWVEHADHSFHVLKSSGTSDAQVLDNMADRTLSFVRAARSPKAGRSG